MNPVLYTEDRQNREVMMTKKTRHVGRESGKSSTKFFGRSESAGTAGGDHGYGARAGDGRTSNPGILGKIKVVFKPGSK